MVDCLYRYYGRIVDSSIVLVVLSLLFGDRLGSPVISLALMTVAMIVAVSAYISKRAIERSATTRSATATDVRSDADFVVVREVEQMATFAGPIVPQWIGHDTGEPWSRPSSFWLVPRHFDLLPDNYFVGVTVRNTGHRVVDIIRGLSEHTGSVEYRFYFDPASGKIEIVPQKKQATQKMTTRIATGFAEPAEVVH